MGFKCGIVGLPNVGKSTLFNALTKAGIDAANYPFCTIDPNVGMVSVPDPRLDQLAEIVKPQKIVPTVMEFVDIAGLVAGASKGEGLGNQFLGHIRETDAIAHVVRCFENDDVVHVSGRVDPISDVETIDTELTLADLEACERGLERARKGAKSGDKAMRQRVETLERLHAHLAEGEPVRTLELSAEERSRIREFHFITAKPVMFIANVDEEGFDNNPLLERIEKHAESVGAEVVSVCGAMEAEMAQLDDAEKVEFLQDLGLDEPGLNRVIRAGYQLLDLMTYFTAGVKEVRAWTVRKGSTAPQAAGCIHTDFEKGFIRAEVIAFEDFIKHRGEQGSREAGRQRLEGKEYIVKEGDVMHFRFNV